MKISLIFRILSIRSRAPVFTLCIIILASIINAQSINVRGRVIDANGQPVAGATAALLKNHGMDSTDSNGNFSIVSNVSTHTVPPAIDRTTLTIELRNNHLVIENSRRSAFAFGLFSLEGRRVYSLERKVLPAGKHVFGCPFDGIATGLYIARINVAGNQISKAVAWLPNSVSRYAATAGRQSFPGCIGKAAAYTDSLMVYKKATAVFTSP